MAVAFLSGNQFRKLFWKITAGFVGYWAVYRNIDRVYSLRTSWHSYLGTSCLSCLGSSNIFWNILAHHLGNILTYLTRGFYPNLFLGNLFTGLSRFIPTFFFGHIIALHRGHLSTIDTIADRIVFTRLHSLTLHSLTLPVEPTLSKTVLHLSQQPV